VLLFETDGGWNKKRRPRINAPRARHGRLFCGRFRGRQRPADSSGATGGTALGPEPATSANQKERHDIESSVRSERVRPVSADQIRQWLAEGRPNAQRRCAEGEAEWRPISACPEFAAVLSPGASGPAFGFSSVSAAAGNRDAALQAVKGRPLRFS